MEPSSPATPPAANQDQPSPTQAVEDEVVASLLLLKEAAGKDEDLDLDEEYYLAPDESTVEVHEQPRVSYVHFFSFQWCKKAPDPSVFLVDLSTWSLINLHGPMGVGVFPGEHGSVEGSFGQDCAGDL